MKNVPETLPSTRSNRGNNCKLEDRALKQWMRENERMRKRNTCGSYHDANPHTGSEIHKQQRRGKRGKHPALGRGIHKLPRFQIDSVLFEYDVKKKK